MSKRKGLGMGLDLLLGASESSQIEEEKSLRNAESLFTKALDADENRQKFEAYYYYRRLIDCLEPSSSLRQEASKELLSRAYNNAAVILSADEAIRGARDFLKKALQANPRNQVARENLQTIDNLQ